MCVYFFFFKQKTAYEMRISDWSSDVCSSDLDVRLRLASRAFVTGVADFTRIKSLPHATEDWETGYWAHLFGLSCAILKAPYPSQPLPYPMTPGPSGESLFRIATPISSDVLKAVFQVHGIDAADGSFGLVGKSVQQPAAFRPEEHTSDIQSLMRIS